MSSIQDGSNRRILVVDDNRSIHDDFRKILCPANAATTASEVTGAALFGTSADAVSQIQFQVDSGFQGQEAVVLVKEALEAGTPYAMAFVDIRMPPGWDGVETARRIWELDPDLQIVLCTAHSDYSWSEVFERLGHSDGLLILKKPFDTVEAFQLAHALTKKWSLHQQSRRKMEYMEMRIAERTSELQGKTAFLEAQSNSSIDGILVVDQQGRKILQNQRMSDLMKIPQDIADDRDDEKQLRWVKGRMRNPEQFIEKVAYLNSHRNETGRDEIELKDGTVLDRYSSPVFGKDEIYYGRIWTFRDITERKAAEAALKEGELRYHSLFNNMLEGCARCELVLEPDRMPDFRYLEINGAFEKVTGLKNVVGKRISEVIIGVQKSNPVFFEVCARVALTGAPERFETHSESLGLWFSVSVYSYEKNGFVMVFDDITERKQAEKALRESEQRFYGAFEHAPIGVALVSPEGRFLKVNGVFCELIGYSLAELLVRTFRDITYPDDLEASLKQVARLLTGEIRSFQIKKRYIHKDRHILTVLLDVSLVRDQEGRPLYFISQIQDISEAERKDEMGKRLAAIVENSNEAIISKTLSGVITSWNPAAERMFGYTAPEIIGQPLLILVPKDRPEEESKILAGFLKGEAVRHIETVGVRKDGRLFDISVTISPIKDADGIIIGASKIVRDITGRKQAEAARDRLSAILESTTDLVSIADLNGRLLYLNGAGRNLLGVGIEEDITLTAIAEFFPHPSSHPTLTVGIPTAAREGTWSGEAVLLSRDGREFPVSQVIVAHKSSGGRLQFYSSIMRDITPLKRVEEELFQSRETLRRILDHIPQRVFWKDRDSVYLGCNDACALDMGLKGSGEVIGKTDFDVSWRIMAESYRADDRSVMDLDSPKMSFEEPGIAADGSPSWLRTNRIPLHDMHGRVTAILGTYEDVTESKLAKLEIERLNADLELRVAQRTEELFAAFLDAERANLAKSEFLSRTSHELRTPLNAILGFAQLLEMKGRPREEADNIEQILKAGRHLLDMVNEVLDISGLEAGRVEMAVRPHEASELVEEALSLARPMAAEREVTLGAPACTSRILVDRQRFKQALLHLIANAIKYNCPRGSVTVRAQETGGMLRIEVTDTGAGIAPADMERIFAPFERLAGAGKVDGIGLGLTFSRRLVERMGGCIGVASTPGVGSTFWMEVPLATRAAATPCDEGVSPFVATGSEVTTSRTLLYIEDNGSNLRLVTRILARRPAIQLVSAGTAEAGMEMAREHRPDLILFDPRTNVRGGFEDLASLRVDPRTSQIPVIILIGEDSPDIRARMLAAGACAVIAKPVEVRTFLGIVDRILGLPIGEPEKTW